MKRLIFLSLALLVALAAQMPTDAQGGDFTIAYGETQSAFFEGQTVTHRWIFFGMPGDVLEIEAYRIAGQFTPRLRLLDSAGALITESNSNPFNDTDTLSLDAGLPGDTPDVLAPYQIEVRGDNIAANQTDNPAEYSLTLRQFGNRGNITLDTPAATSVDFPAIPDVTAGDPVQTTLSGVGIYGAEPLISRSDTPNIPVRVLFTTDTIQLAVNNTSPIVAGVDAVRFLQTDADSGGVALLARNDRLTTPVPFYSDTDLLIAYEPTQRLYTFQIEDGPSIVTDFNRVTSMQYRDGRTLVEVEIDGETKRLQLASSEIDLRRRGGLGETVAPQTTLLLDDGRFINTDFLTVDALTYVDGNLLARFGKSAYYVTDNVRLDAIRQNSDGSTQITQRVPAAGDSTRQLEMTIHWRGMGVVATQGNELRVNPLDGRTLNEPIISTVSLEIRAYSVRYTRQDGTLLTSLRDGTRIQTPAALPDNPDVLPYDANYRPRNFNNLGEDFFPLCPCVNDTQENKPVNPANGNFFYPVTDFRIPGHTLELDLTRYYNSHDTGLTPAYMRTSPAGYLPQQMGTGWRHSYQYDLDISGAPKGRLTLILPDGSQHLFFPAGNPGADPRWSSRTLLQWTIEQRGGTLGTWQAVRTDGVRYYFDKAGRLERISETDNRSLTFSPLPSTAQYSSLGVQGMFITEPYGRRLELYAGDDGLIRLARDTSGRRITYAYDDGLLANVEYITPNRTAQYTYDDLGLLVALTDARSPYQPLAAIEYDASQRVSAYTENPDGALMRRFSYRYRRDATADTRTTIQNTTVNNQPREIRWIYNGLWQLTTRTTPREGEQYEYLYDENTGVLVGIRQPSLVVFRYSFDAQGQLTRFEDPFLNAYNFNYRQQGDHRLVSEIRYPNNRVDTFTWSDDDDYPTLVAHEQLQAVTSAGRITRTTRYEYDDWGRLVMQVAPGAIATRYTYDAFGYVAEIWQGIVLQEGETAADIDDRSRAQRILSFSYDLIGQLRAYTDGRGNRYTLNWDSSIEQLREINGPLGIAIQYTYDDFGRVAQVDDRGQTTSYTYNPAGNVTAITNAAGIITTYTYDEAGNLLSTVDDLQRETRYEYNELDQLTRMISPAGLATTYETFIEEEGDFTVRRVVDPAGRETTRQYDALGRLRRYILSDGDWSQEYRIEYNTANYPTSIIESLSGRGLSLEYNLIGDVQAMDTAGARTEFDYDARGQLTEVTSPAGRVTQYQYDAAGNITGVTLPDGGTLQYTYDENNNVLRAEDSGGLVTNYVYDMLNQVISKNDPAGNTTSYFYDNRGNLITLIDPRETSRSFEYDALDRLVEASDGRQQATTFQYDDVGRLFNVQQPGVRSTRFTYDDEDNIIAVTERPREQRTLYSYDNIGRISSITDPLGHTNSYVYYAMNRLERIIDPIGNVKRYNWQRDTLNLARFEPTTERAYEFNTDVLGRLTTIRDVVTEQNEAINTQFTYDADGYVRTLQIGTDQARVSGINDELYQYTYDASGRITQYTDPRGGEWSLLYDASGRLSGYTDPAGAETQYTRDAAGNITQVTQFAGTEVERSEQFRYDRNGNIEEYISPTGVINRYTYDANNQLVEARFAAETEFENRTLFEYNGRGQLIRIEDALGNETRYFFQLDRINRVEHDLGDQMIATNYNYDDAGNLRSIVLPARDEDQNALITLSQTYDALDRRVRFVNGEDNVWSYTYDSADNISQISDPLGNIVQYTYDNYDRVTQIQYPTGSVVNLRYDTAGNLRDVILPANDNGNRQTLTYVLDIAGNVQEIREGGNITRYEYDATGNLTRRIFPDGRETTYDYDPAGNLLAIRYDDGSEITYAWDADDRLLRAGDERYEYDPLGRLQQVIGQITIDYEYDLAGNLLERDAGDYGTTRYTYDPLYRPVQVALDDTTVNIIYDNRGQIRQMLRSNGVRTVINYDAAGRPISILHLNANNERLDGFNYQYDAVGNLIITDRITDGTRILYSYDVAHRLIDERWLNAAGENIYTVGFRYDAAGNRVEELRNGRRTRFEYNDQNQLVREVRDAPPESDLLRLPGGLALVGLLLLAGHRRRRWLLPVLLALLVSGIVIAQPNPQIANVSYSYDSSGNLAEAAYTTRNGETYTLQFDYDNENRLQRVQGDDEFGRSVDTQMTYDMLSRLVEWREGDSRYRMVYDNRDMLGMDNLDNDSDGIDRFLQVAQARILTMRATDDDPETVGQLWHLNDRIDSPRRFTDASGQLFDDPSRLLEYSSFGVRIFPYEDNGTPPDAARIAQPMPTFAGHTYDPSTQLYLIGVRGYDPQTARFLQPDPLRQDPIGTLYTYARNRPLVFTDSLGLNVEPIIDPTNVAVLADELQPENLIPRPQQPAIPQPPTVHRLQGDESFRALELLSRVRYETNSPVARLSPLLDDFHTFQSNPMPPELVALSAAPLDAQMAIYRRGEGWLPDPTTDPFIAGDPFQPLRAARPLLARTTIDPLAWCGFSGNDRASRISLLPALPQPTGLSLQWQAEAQLMTGLQPVPLMTALDSRSADLRTLPQTLTVPGVMLPSVNVPSVAIEPPILTSLDHLREQTYAIQQRIINAGFSDCVDCVPPLSFSQ